MSTALNHWIRSIQEKNIHTTIVGSIVRNMIHVNIQLRPVNSCVCSLAEESCNISMVLAGTAGMWVICQCYFYVASHNSFHPYSYSNSKDNLRSLADKQGFSKQTVKRIWRTWSQVKLCTFVTQQLSCIKWGGGGVLSFHCRESSQAHHQISEGVKEEDGVRLDTLSVADSITIYL